MILYLIVHTNYIYIYKYMHAIIYHTISFSSINILLYNIFL